jgi:hypothetical protein
MWSSRQFGVNHTPRNDKIVSLEKQVARLSVADDFALERLSGGHRLSIDGTVALAIRRNLSNISCGDFGKVLLDNVSKWTVARAEVRTGNALMASHKLFFQTVRDSIYGPVDACSLFVCAFRSDATGWLAPSPDPNRAQAMNA